MKLIIDIDDVLYYKICSLKDSEIDTSSYMAIKNGKPYKERPVGYWIGNNYDEHHCKKCGRYALYEEEADGQYYEVQSNFCPNCGAEMGGTDHEIDN